MRKLLLFLLVLISVFSCRKDPLDEDYMIIDGRRTELKYGYFYEYGFNPANSTRLFSVLITNNSTLSEDFIQFQLVCNDNIREIEDRYYIYEGSSVYEPGNVINLQFAKDVEYDANGYFDGGTFYFDNFCNVKVIRGYTDVIIDSPRYTINLSATVVKNNDTIDVEAYYRGRLTELEYDFIDYVYYNCNK